MSTGRPAGWRRCGPNLADQSGATGDLGQLAPLFLLEVGAGYPQANHQLFMQENLTVLGDGPKGQFGIVRGAQFMRQHHVQVSIKRPGKFTGYHQPAPGDAQHYRLPTTPASQLLAEKLPRLLPIAKGRVAAGDDAQFPHIFIISFQGAEVIEMDRFVGLN
jgi:hypothetical protein